jgi:hypothetical protein
LKNLLLAGLVAVSIFALTGCNSTTRILGGTSTIDLPQGTKLVGSPQWDGNHLWVNTRPMEPNEKAETYDFKEYSQFGILSGNVIIHEHK